MHLDVGLEGEGGDSEGVHEQVAPVLQLPAVEPDSGSYSTLGTILLEENQKKFGYC